MKKTDLKTGDILLYKSGHFLARAIRFFTNGKVNHADYLELTGQQLYPDLIALLDVVKSIDNTNIVNDSENTYVYLDEVFDYHIPIISKYNAIVETKPIN